MTLTAPSSHESDAKTLHQALTADEETIYRLLSHPPPDLLRALMRNPALNKNHLLSLLRQRELAADIFTIIHHHLETAVDNHQLVLAVVQHPETPAHISLTLLPQLYLFELLSLCRQPQASHDQRLAAERTILQRLPTQPLGNKLTLARQGTPAILEALLKDGHPQVIAICLDNPRLKEGALHQFISSGVPTAETLSLVARHPYWHHRPNLQLAILKNPRTPTIWYTLWLPKLKRGVLKDLSASPRLTAQQKACVKQALGNCR